MSPKRLAFEGIFGYPSKTPMSASSSVAAHSSSTATCGRAYSACTHAPASAEMMQAKTQCHNTLDFKPEERVVQGLHPHLGKAEPEEQRACGHPATPGSGNSSAHVHTPVQCGSVGGIKVESSSGSTEILPGSHAERHTSVVGSARPSAADLSPHRPSHAEERDKTSVPSFPSWACPKAVHTVSPSESLSGRVAEDTDLVRYLWAENSRLQEVAQEHASSVTEVRLLREELALKSQRTDQLAAEHDELKSSFALLQRQSLQTEVALAETAAEHKATRSEARFEMSSLEEQVRRLRTELQDASLSRPSSYASVPLHPHSDRASGVRTGPTYSASLYNMAENESDVEWQDAVEAPFAAHANPLSMAGFMGPHLSGPDPLRASTVEQPLRTSGSAGHVRQTGNTDSTRAGMGTASSYAACRSRLSPASSLPSDSASQSRVLSPTSPVPAGFGRRNEVPPILLAKGTDDEQQRPAPGEEYPDEDPYRDAQEQNGRDKPSDDERQPKSERGSDKRRRRKKGHKRDPSSSPPSSSSSSSSSRGSARRRRRRRAKSKKSSRSRHKYESHKGEASELKLPALPSMENYAQWCIAVHNVVLAGSGVGYKAFDWICKCEKPNVSLGDLADSEGFSSLDFKLAGAIARIQSGLLTHTLTRYALEYAQHGVPLKGRQMLLIIHQNYQTCLQTGQLYRPQDLLNVTLKGDSAMEEFLERWMLVLSAVEAKIPEGFAHDAFLEQMENSSALKGTLEYYHRLPPGHADKTYEFLLQAATQVVTRKNHVKNRLALTKNLAGAQKEQPPPPRKSTEVCRDYQRSGTCRRGDACQFVHTKPKGPRRERVAAAPDAASQPGNSRQSSVSRPAASGGNAQGGRKRDDRHGRDRKQRSLSAQSGRTNSSGKRNPCFDWSLGRCQRGSACKYERRSLTEGEKRRRDRPRSQSNDSGRSQSASSGDKPKLCPQFLKGQCRNGQSCSMRHERPKRPTAVATPRLAIPASHMCDVDVSTPRFRPPVADE